MVVVLGLASLFSTGVLKLGTPGGKVIRDPSAATLPITLSDTAQVTGTLAQGNGGTNATTDFSAGAVIVDDGTRFIQNVNQLNWDNTNFRLGVATVTPGTELSVGGNLFVDATTTVGALFATNTLAVASSSPGSNVQLAVVGHSVLNGNLSVLGVFDSQGTATNTFDGGATFTGLYTTGGIRLDVGDLIVDQSIKSATSTTDDLIINRTGICKGFTTTNTSIDVTKGCQASISVTTDTTLDLVGEVAGQTFTLGIYHDHTSGNSDIAWSSSTPFYFTGGKATTTSTGAGDLDVCSFRVGFGTSTSPVIVTCAPNFH